VSRRIVNILFHGIGAPPRSLSPGEADIWVEATAFSSILEAVRARDDVAISFDDGNPSDTEIALPILLELGLRARFFLVAERLQAADFITDEGVRRLVDAGMEIGLHGLRHRNWRELDDHALHEELIDARATLERNSGQRVVTAACPFGAYDRRVLRALRRAGYERVYTSDGGAANPNAWLQPRYCVGRTDDAGLVERIVAADRSPGTRALFRAKRIAKSWR
jgi:peptidoglycan/xylan/chitin deacetylase (PgdA/CDA1 family)